MISPNDGSTLYHNNSVLTQNKLIVPGLLNFDFRFKNASNYTITFKVRNQNFNEETEIYSRAKGISGFREKREKNINFAQAKYHKMSLGGKNRKEVHDWCLENEFIALGYGDNVDHSKYLAIKDWADF